MSREDSRYLDKTTFKRVDAPPDFNGQQPSFSANTPLLAKHLRDRVLENFLDCVVFGRWDTVSDVRVKE